MFDKTTIRDIDPKNKNILVRTDFNVPVKNDQVTSDFRLRAALPTIQYLIDRQANHIILISHLGRPKGQADPALSLAPVAQELSLLLNRPVTFIPHLTGSLIKDQIDSLPQGSVVLLENLRFSAAEEENSLDFARKIVHSTSADLYVQDGFAVIHRAHASTAQIPQLLPTVAGFLVEKEVTNLSQVLQHPKPQVTVIIGGAKISDKQPLIDRFLPIADHILVVGKIAADGYVSNDPKIYVAEDFRQDQEGNKLDIGELSLSKILPTIKYSHTIIWNGTAGKTEESGFDLSSKAIAEAIGQKNPEYNQTIILGGDTSGYVEKLLEEQSGASLGHVSSPLEYSLISTGGGASLEFLLGLPLPGLDAIN